jgi:hypothetical protein
MEKLFNSDYFGGFDVLDEKVEKRNIVAFDSEDDTNGTPLAFSFYDGGKVLKKKYFYTRSAEEAMKFIYNYPIPSAFISHNLEYDLPNLMKFCDFMFVDEIIKAPLMMQVSLIGTNQILMNSFSYYKGSVKNMAKLVGLKKLEGKKGDKNLGLNKAYAIRDAEIVYKYMVDFQKRLNNDFGVKLGLSIGSIAMGVYRTRFMIGNKQATYCNPLLVEKAYYGGRVEVFYRGMTEEKINYCDINSSYPNVMKNYQFPDPQFLEVSKLATHKFGVGHFRVTVPSTVFIPVLPVKSDNGRLFFPTGTFEGYWTYAEVRKAIEQGAKIEAEMDGVGTNAPMSPFSDFIDYFYTKRLKTKDKLKKNPYDTEALAESDLLKVIMNSLYGKWCQNKPRTKLSRRPIPAETLERNLGEYEEKRVGTFWEYKATDDKPPKTANFIWGLHVTAYARLELVKHLENVHKNGGVLLYCDTDSIIFTGDKALAAMPISSKLGDLSHETYDRGIFRQAKGYLLCDFDGPNLVIKKAACKGIATSHAYEFIVEGIATSVKPMRFKEALIRTGVKANADKILNKEIGFNIWRDVKKVMQAIDIKRSVGEGVTFPIDFKDIEYLEENATQKAENWSSKLKDNPIALEQKEDYFRGVQIPKNWFRETGIPAEVCEPSTKQFFIRRTDIKGVTPGSIWFSGDVIRVVDIRGKKCVELILGCYFGEFFKHRDIIALLPLSTLKILETNEKKISGKRIIVTLDDDLELQIEVFHKVKKVKLDPIPKKMDDKKLQNDRLKEFLAKRAKILSEKEK